MYGLNLSLPLYRIRQGSTIGVRRVCMYAYFYWHSHDLGHVYVDTYPHFPYDFLEFSKFFWFLQWFKNLLLYI